MLVAESLSKTFEDGTLAVDDVSFEVRGGECLALLGANGAGKTTTLHMLLGHVAPTSGRSLVGGVSMQDDPLEARKRLGYVSENVLLYGPLTARQNLRFFARISGRDVPQAVQDAALARVGLADAARRRVETFSKGMRQRLGIAIALQKEPDALLLDEPTTGLDPVGVRELEALMIDLRAEGRSILLVTHDLHRLHEVATRVGVLAGARLAAPVVARTPGAVLALYLAAVAPPGGAASG